MGAVLSDIPPPILYAVCSSIILSLAGVTTLRPLLEACLISSGSLCTTWRTRQSTSLLVQAPHARYVCYIRCLFHEALPGQSTSKHHQSGHRGALLQPWHW